MKNKKLLPIFLILFFSLFWLLKFKSNFFSETDVNSAGNAYANSQYVLGDGSTKKIDDATVYAYASYRYVLGEDPTHINFEHPPLGKYLIGFSWLLFGNMTVINFIFYIACLFVFWKISKVFIKGFYFRILALILLCSISLIPYYVFQSMLDIQLLFYTLLLFYSFSCVNGSKKRIILAGVSLGAYASTKFYFPTTFLLVFILFYDSLSKKRINEFFYIAFFSSLFYLLTYSVYFMNNPNPIDFVKFEWYRFRWWTGNRSMPRFLIIDNIFIGKFKGWWEENVFEVSPNWNLSWPLIFIGWIIGLFNMAKNKEIATVSIFSVCLLALYCFGSASNERYLIQLIPFWIIVLAAFLDSKFRFNKN